MGTPIVQVLFWSERLRTVPKRLAVEIIGVHVVVHACGALAI